jgi:hypothetical protein
MELRKLPARTIFRAVRWKFIDFRWSIFPRRSTVQMGAVYFFETSIHVWQMKRGVNLQDPTLDGGITFHTYILLNIAVLKSIHSRKLFAWNFGFLFLF